MLHLVYSPLKVRLVLDFRTAKRQHQKCQINYDYNDRRDRFDPKGVAIRAKLRVTDNRSQTAIQTTFLYIQWYFSVIVLNFN